MFVDGGNDRIGPVLGARRFGSFFDQDSFDSEHAAYRTIAAVPALRHRVCPCYGVYEAVDLLFRQPCYSHALCLRLLPGQTLWHTLYPTPPPPAERRRLHLRLRETLAILHDQAGLYHGDVKEDNIFVCGADVWLLDFGAARFGIHVDDKRWRRRTHADLVLLDGIFSDADSHKAKQDALTLLERMPPDSPSHQMALARLLSRAGSAHVDTAFLHRISAQLPHPSAELALALATLLAALHDHASALHTLSTAISHLEATEQHTAAARPSALLRHRMLSVAASCASHGELGALKPCTSKPGHSRRAS
ncbi:hypothetical protein UCRNP2_1080 [Neofusicoccum parvum UCRNP2]|uniref:Protein kinase domain-containing protein n=1 Tax=Botryosphaeria parva (strain UCR-NP2) TaxID=1287680 RepID=R1GKB9_BOTPV|nr:hypothetical protein UCRNP2_1080 [Neofusicoccum parvum UCRNP2]